MDYKIVLINRPSADHSLRYSLKLEEMWWYSEFKTDTIPTIDWDDELAFQQWQINIFAFDGTIAPHSIKMTTCSFKK